MDKYNKIQKGFELIIEGLGEVFKNITDSFNKACKQIAILLNPALNKKITKKKFCKLLQSHGIQRNEIELLVKNNRREYTYRYLYEILANKEG